MPHQGDGSGAPPSQALLDRASTMLFGGPMGTIKKDRWPQIRQAAEQLQAWRQTHGSLADFPGFGKGDAGGNSHPGNGGNGQQSPAGSATAEPHGNVGLIVQFLRGKGLSDPVIAGILGNMSVEDSSFNPTVPNPGEGAIGLCQWEGGRRTALQNWAAAHGGTEGQLQMQLGYMWHELNTSESGVLAQIRGMTDPGQVAAIWDAQYERSSGEARQQRVNNAQAFLNNNLRPIGGNSSNAGGNYVQPAGSGGGGGGGGAGPLTRHDLNSVDGLGKLLDQVPQLRHLVDQALANNWSTAHFENQIENSDWWKNHSQTARGILITQANDPATYQQNLTGVENSISGLSKQLGMQLTQQQLQAIATSALLSGNDGNQQWITQQISNREDYSHIGSTDNLAGGMASTSQQLLSMAADYGYKWSPSDVAVRAQNILDGTTTIDTYKQRLIAWASSAFPGLSKELQSGTTLKDLADPYVTSMSQLLEVDPGTLNVYTPKIRRALQGAAPDGAKPGTEPSPMPLWQFENHLRSDPRWGSTQNAKDTMSSALLQIGNVFGFGPTG